MLCGKRCGGDGGGAREKSSATGEKAKKQSTGEVRQSLFRQQRSCAEDQ